MKHTTVFKFFLVAGGLFLVAGWHQYETTSAFVASAERGFGFVVRLDATGNGSFRPVVEWTDHTGTSRTLYTSTSTSPPGFFEGEQVTVLYDPSDQKYPLDARIGTTLHLWGVSIFLAIFGTAWILIASVSWYVYSKGGVIVFDGSHRPRPAKHGIRGSGFNPDA